MPATPTDSSLVGRILRLSVGTLATRGFSVLGQFLLAIWLTPAEFGYWAAAVSTVSLVGGLTNFGEVNGYLASGSSDVRLVLRATRRLNVLLMAAGMLIAYVYLRHGSPRVAGLAAVAALTIPLQGESDVLYAQCVRMGRLSSVVRAQTIAAAGKVVVGVLLAVWTRSSFAIAVSIALMFLIMTAHLRWDGIPLHPGVAETPGHEPVAWRTRATWSVNSLMQTLPIQVGFIVTQFVSPVDLLGIYYYGYQVTTGISGLLAVPLSRSTLAAVSDVLPGARADFIHALAARFCSLVAVATALLTVLGLLVMPLIQGAWAHALPATVILLGSLPARMLNPIIDAYQQAAGRWWRSTSFNLVDTVGTGLVSAFGITGNVTTLVIAVSLWKLAFSTFRGIHVLGGQAAGTIRGLTLPVTAFGVATILLGLLGRAPALYLAITVLALACMWAMRANGVTISSLQTLLAHRRTGNAVL